MKLGVVILAAGQGTRMRSSLPKVLHTLAGRSLLGHVVKTTRELGAARTVVVYGYGGEQVRAALSSEELEWVAQEQQLGTGHAVDRAMPALKELDRVLVLYGDVPLIRAETLSALIQAGEETELALLTVGLDDPGGYGRIVRNRDGKVACIVEQKDASPEELAIKEINTGFLISDCGM